MFEEEYNILGHQKVFLGESNCGFIFLVGNCKNRFEGGGRGFFVCGGEGYSYCLICFGSAFN